MSIKCLQFFDLYIPTTYLSWLRISKLLKSEKNYTEKKFSDDSKRFRFFYKDPWHFSHLSNMISHFAPPKCDILDALVSIPCRIFSEWGVWKYHVDHWNYSQVCCCCNQTIFATTELEGKLNLVIPPDRTSYIPKVIPETATEKSFENIYTVCLCWHSNLLI